MFTRVVVLLDVLDEPPRIAAKVITYQVAKVPVANKTIPQVTFPLGYGGQLKQCLEVITWMYELSTSNRCLHFSMYIILDSSWFVRVLPECCTINLEEKTKQLWGHARPTRNINIQIAKYKLILQHTSTFLDVFQKHICVIFCNTSFGSSKRWDMCSLFNVCYLTWELLKVSWNWDLAARSGQ